MDFRPHFRVGHVVRWVPPLSAVASTTPGTASPMSTAGRVLLGISSALALKLPTSATGPLSGKLPPSFSLPRGKNVILFDGVCNFCNRWVNFVLDNDPEGIFVFASMQSPAGRHLLDTCGRPPDDLSTFVMIDGEGFWTQSTAALRVAEALPRPTLNVLGGAFMPLPAALRDVVYQTVATNRYSILGRDDDGATPSCMLRDDAFAMRERFLDQSWTPPTEDAPAGGT